MTFRLKAKPLDRLAAYAVRLAVVAPPPAPSIRDTKAGRADSRVQFVR